MEHRVFARHALAVRCALALQATERDGENGDGAREMPGQERTDTGEGAGDERATLETSPASNHAATRADEATADDATFNALSTTFGLTRWRKLARGAKEVGRKAARKVSKRMIKLLDMSLPWEMATKTN